MHELYSNAESLWVNYSRLNQQHPASDSEAKVTFYQNNSQNIRRNSTNNHPRCAVILPAYNESEFIPRTLASLNSSLTNVSDVAVFVVDNASTDDTAEIATAFGSQVIYESQKGIGNARQTGLEALPSSVEFVLTTDADTVVFENWLRLHQLSLVKSNTVASYVKIYFRPDIPLSRLNSLIFSGYTLAANVVHSINNHHQSLVCGGANMGYRKEAANICGGYDRNLNCGEDTDLLCRISKLGEISKNESRVFTSSRRIIGEGIVRHSLNRLKDNFLRYSGRNPVSKQENYKDFR
jgi:glycosyltransferase involved in cell wall biosynthesis